MNNSSNSTTDTIAQKGIFRATSVSDGDLYFTYVDMATEQVRNGSRRHRVYFDTTGELVIALSSYDEFITDVRKEIRAETALAERDDLLDFIYSNNPH